MQSEVSPILVATHELKGPLATLRQLAFAVDACADDARRSHLASEMVSVADRALRQVTDLTKVSRLEDALFVLEPVAVRGVCTTVVDDLSRLFAARGRGLDVDFHQHARLVTAHRDLLYSVIYNFCANAVHYSHPGTRSRLTVMNHADHVRIAVRDYGPALPLSLWRELRSGTVARPTAIAMRPSSSGLGLYIASEFSRYMGGHLGAIRHRDGTSFFVDLNVSQQASLFS